MSEPTGSTEPSTVQEPTEPSAATTQVTTEPSAAQESTVSIEEFNKVKQALAEVLTKKDKYKGLSETLQTEKDAALKKAAENATDPDDLRKKYEDIISGRDKTISDMKQSARKKEVHSRVKSVASKLKAVNPEHILRLITPDIIFDEDNKAFINDGNGEPKINPASGKRVTVEEQTAELLADNTNLVQSSGQTGAGGSRGSSGKSGIALPKTAEDVRNMGAENYRKNIKNMQRAAELEAGINYRR